MLVRVTVYVGCLSGVINDDDNRLTAETRRCPLAQLEFSSALQLDLLLQGAVLSKENHAKLSYCTNAAETDGALSVNLAFQRPCLASVI